MKALKFAALGAALLAASSAAHAGTTFDNVKKKGYVQCGVSTGIPGFSIADSKGEWKGIDVDLCRAIAATMFGDATKFKVTPLNTQQRFTALQSGEIDALTRNTTVTQTRDTTLGLIGVGVNYYDSQGVMVSKDLGVKSAKELGGATICVQPGTTTELNLADWFRANKIEFKPVVIDKYDEIVRAFSAGRCDAFTTDKSQLASTRTTLENPEKYIILPEDFSKEPLGPMVRQGDEQWFNVVRWALNAMLEAEEYGITSKNVDEQLKSSNPNVQRILGVTPGMGKNLGVDDKWAYNVIKQVGNYGESFESTLGKNGPMKLDRGLNASYKQGGLMYGWPVR
ncbi:amino acid ABC transporter substrate-binding protein [Bordetella holmesii]|uniref:General L-amino acid-binding periplasmic protein AapJ n=2 Tax=Bordetella holmesii TaxID=35814 RepID=A0A158M8J6_9BORD|nr:amino acid ABC transporter substrate-binding protein [Bordetella holmesii]AHV94882.1 bacterial extracellular solute-binding s, 3 family protein [Bordetella holmesii ATCC 51541]AIT26560.1 bacterial extracellular solute-binding s, 3 family protein [Bordetella holmesii 44057]EWM42230.1 bacterial extracellular solute-binding s, 3 family protein [Bordetella holmesii 41130]EWM47139.1 bacterial extracellular solute-binding s, 3 family protein [Bordetella holmesii 35009]EWM51303.1 bacterial extrace